MQATVIMGGKNAEEIHQLKESKLRLSDVALNGIGIRHSTYTFKK